MKREIKFRGISKTTGKWIYGYYQKLGEMSFIWPDYAPDSFDRYQVDPDTVGQFTGLKDKNLVEVHEGDILRYFNRIGKVIWHEYQSCFDLVFIENIEGEPFIKMNKGISANNWRFKAEVTGNIHEK